MKLRASLPFAGLLAALALVSCGKKEKQETAESKPAVPVAKAEAPPKPNLDSPADETTKVADEDMPDEEEPSLPDNEATPPPNEPVPPSPSQANPAPAKVKKKPK